MEELARIKRRLMDEEKTIFDFGTGDPRIPTWPSILESIKEGLPEISQYPSIRGEAELINAIWGYLKRRFQIDKTEEYGILPSNGSKEAVFNIALCLVGRQHKHTIAYPNPGYPVYRSSTLFARGKPYPVDISQNSNLSPWELPESVQDDLAAVWVNYPHNPTGAVATNDYLSRLCEWSAYKSCPILSDECYTDIYNPTQPAPAALIQLKPKHAISFFSLSKRSGLTGYRSGFIFAHRNIITKLAKARANFGVGTPTPIQAGATTAWQDDHHVAERRKLFYGRMKAAFPTLQKLGMINSLPAAGFYLWCKLPSIYKGNDVDFALELAERGVIVSPSSWLSEGISGYVRFAMVPEQDKIEEAMKVLDSFVAKIQ